MTEPAHSEPPKKDYWSPEERRARAERRKARQAKAEAFAELFVKHGKLPPASREMWPGLSPEKSYDKGKVLARTRAFREALPKVAARIEVRTGATSEWVIRKLLMHAQTAPKASDRIRALELLGRHLGMFVERKEVRSVRLDLATMPTPDLLRLLNEKRKLLRQHQSQLDG